MRRGSGLLAAALCAVVLGSASAHAADPAAAREQLKVGYLLAQDGKFGEALPHLAESLRLDPKAITLINLADCEEKLGHFADALGHWVDARARAQAENVKGIEEEATNRAKALEPRLARVTIRVAAGAPSDTVVERDGVTLGSASFGIPLPLDPGTHSLVVKASGHEPKPHSLVVAEGETKDIELDLGPVQAVRPPSLPKADTAPVKRDETGTNPLVYLGFGVGAVGLAVGTVTGIIALGKGSDAETNCPQLKCSQSSLDDVESGRTLGTVSTISFIVAGVGVAVGVYGLLAKPGKAAAVHTVTTNGLRIRF